MGSSPPVRGAHTVCPIPRRPAGLIPARAGSTCGQATGRCRRRAHPRPCGEHVDASPASSKEPGSSPPVRGALDSRSAWPGRAGLIPARAGSTILSLDLLVCSWAHPRPCGEHSFVPYRGPLGSGSSPPVRGALSLDFGPCGDDGLIPARAGSTLHRVRRNRINWAHPRPCGEHALMILWQVVSRGSSPPVRGAHTTFKLIAGVVGLIPARAGSTTDFYHEVIQVRAHPRPCGEHKLASHCYSQ